MKKTLIFVAGALIAAVLLKHLDAHAFTIGAIYGSAYMGLLWIIDN